MNMRDCRINVPPRRTGQWTSGAMGQSGSMSQHGATMGQPGAMRQSGAMPGAATGQMMPMPGRSMSDMLQMGTQEDLMRMINEASFALDDILLFLDTHPEDAAAMQYYQNVAAMRRNAMNAYQNQFGPLMVDDVRGNRWDWVTEKWPWEGGC